MQAEKETVALPGDKAPAAIEPSTTIADVEVVACAGDDEKEQMAAVDRFTLQALTLRPYSAMNRVAEWCAAQRAVYREATAQQLPRLSQTLPPPYSFAHGELERTAETGLASATAAQTPPSLLAEGGAVAPQPPPCEDDAREVVASSVLTNDSKPISVQDGPTEPSEIAMPTERVRGTTTDIAVERDAPETASVHGGDDGNVLQPRRPRKSARPVRRKNDDVPSTAAAQLQVLHKRLQRSVDHSRANEPATTTTTTPFCVLALDPAVVSDAAVSAATPEVGPGTDGDELRRSTAPSSPHSCSSSEKSGVGSMTNVRPGAVTSYAAFHERLTRRAIAPCTDVDVKDHPLSEPPSYTASVQSVEKNATSPFLSCALKLTQSWVLLATCWLPTTPPCTPFSLRSGDSGRAVMVVERTGETDAGRIREAHVHELVTRRLVDLLRAWSLLTSHVTAAHFATESGSDCHPAQTLEALPPRFTPMSIPSPVNESETTDDQVVSGILNAYRSMGVYPHGLAYAVTEAATRPSPACCTEDAFDYFRVRASIDLCVVADTKVTAGRGARLGAALDAFARSGTMSAHSLAAFLNDAFLTLLSRTPCFAQVQHDESQKVDVAQTVRETSVLRATLTPALAASVGRRDVDPTPLALHVTALLLPHATSRRVRLSVTVLARRPRSATRRGFDADVAALTTLFPASLVLSSHTVQVAVSACTLRDGVVHVEPFAPLSLPRAVRASPSPCKTPPSATPPQQPSTPEIEQRASSHGSAAPDVAACPSPLGESCTVAAWAQCLDAGVRDVVRALHDATAALSATQTALRALSAGQFCGTVADSYVGRRASLCSSEVVLEPYVRLLRDTLTQQLQSVHGVDDASSFDAAVADCVTVKALTQLLRQRLLQPLQTLDDRLRQMGVGPSTTHNGRAAGTGAAPTARSVPGARLVQNKSKPRPSNLVTEGEMGRIGKSNALLPALRVLDWVLAVSERTRGPTCAPATVASVWEGLVRTEDGGDNIYSLDSSPPVQDLTAARDALVGQMRAVADALGRRAAWVRRVGAVTEDDVVPFLHARASLLRRCARDYDTAARQHADVISAAGRATQRGRKSVRAAATVVDERVVSHTSTKSVSVENDTPQTSCAAMPDSTSTETTVTTLLEVQPDTVVDAVDVRENTQPWPSTLTAAERGAESGMTGAAVRPVVENSFASTASESRRSANRRRGVDGPRRTRTEDATAELGVRAVGNGSARRAAPGHKSETPRSELMGKVPSMPRLERRMTVQDTTMAKISLMFVLCGACVLAALFWG